MEKEKIIMTMLKYSHSGLDGHPEIFGQDKILEFAKDIIDQAKLEGELKAYEDFYEVIVKIGNQEHIGLLSIIGSRINKLKLLSEVKE